MQQLGITVNAAGKRWKLIQINQRVADRSQAPGKKINDEIIKIKVLQVGGLTCPGVEAASPAAGGN